MARQLIQRVKGTRDFDPKDWEYQKWLEAQFISLGATFGYQAYEGSIIEHMDLYLGKSSEEIVNQQTFSLTDRDGKLLVLRPELTPTLARMVAEREGRAVFPIRWQSYGRFFRYERPQRGRGRSFFQWNIDLLGCETCHADAEIVTIACLMFRNLGLTPDHVTIKINDRLGLEQTLQNSLEIPQESVRPLFSLIDRIDKTDPAKFHTELEKTGLSGTQIDKLHLILEAKDLAFSPWLQEIMALLDLNGVADYVEPDLKIVRGFDYYTRTVFEAWAKTSLRRAIFGGGRYDNLTVQVGGRQEVPGVGFAVGDMAMTELLKEVDLYPEIRAKCADILVTVFSEDLVERSASFARSVREHGIPVELYLNPKHRLDKQLKYADRKGIPFVAIIGPDEVQSNAVVLKNLSNRTQEVLPGDKMDALLSHLKNKQTK